MTEAEWLAHDDPVAMLEFVAGHTSERKLRLFLCACCSRVLQGAAIHDANKRGRFECLQMLVSAVKALEQFADGLAGPKALEAARRLAKDAPYVPAYIDYGGESGLDYEADAVREAAARPLTPEGAVSACRRALLALQKHRPHAAGASPDPMIGHRRDMARWLREIVGNPFRPVDVDPAWLAWGDGAVANVAESIYERGSFGELRFLADALEDAGCTNADVLDHLRSQGPHVRGCWALDLFVEAPRRFALAAASPEPEQESPLAEPPPPAQPRPQLRPGDWFCPGCETHNFARRDACMKCHAARPAPRLRPGDWVCAGCKAHNFARRQTCHQCRGARPS